MNHRHLDYFTKVVQQGSIKSAAASLGVTQPAISAAIRKLEREFGVPLLDRDAHGSTPTIYGKSLYSSALTLGSIIKSAKRKIGTLQNPSEGHLRIGTGPSVSVAQISRMVAELMADYPGIRVDHIASNSFENFEQLLVAEEIDVAFCRIQPDLLPRAISHQLVSNNPIGMLVSAQHLPPETTSITMMETLTEFAWIVPKDDDLHPPEGTKFSDQLKVLKAPVAVTADDLGMIKYLTLNTKAISFMPLHVAMAELQTGELVELVLEGADANRPIYALTKTDANPTPTLERFLEKIEPALEHELSNFTPHRQISIRP